MNLYDPANTRDPLTNIESEFALLCGLLYDSRRVDPVIDILDEADFSQPFFGRIYGLISSEHSKSNSLNPLTLRPFIENDPAYSAMGGMALIAKFTSDNSVLVNTKDTAKQIAQLAKRRAFLDGLQDAVAIVTDPGQAIEVAVDAAETAMVEATAKASALSQPTGAQAMDALLKSVEKPKRTIRSSRVQSIDELVAPRPKQLIIGGGRPGMGKSAAALSYSIGCAQNGHGVLFVSLEMDSVEIAARMAADMAFNGHNGVSYADINSDEPSPRAIRAMQDARHALDRMPFQMIDAGSLSIGKLELLVKRYKRRFAAKGATLDLVVIDYLQLLRTDDKSRSAYEAVSEISRRLKGVAKDYDVAVFALAQLSRGVESREDKRPMLADLRDSGQIEQDADAVIFFYRHAYYLRKAGETDEAAQQAYRECETAIEFDVAKRRNGAPGRAVGEFHGQFQAVRG